MQGGKSCILGSEKVRKAMKATDATLLESAATMQRVAKAIQGVSKGEVFAIEKYFGSSESYKWALTSRGSSFLYRANQEYEISKKAVVIFVDTYVQQELQWIRIPQDLPKAAQLFGEDNIPKIQALYERATTTGTIPCMYYLSKQGAPRQVHAVLGTLPRISIPANCPPQDREILYLSRLWGSMLTRP